MVDKSEDFVKITNFGTLVAIVPNAGHNRIH